MSTKTVNPHFRGIEVIDLNRAGDLKPAVFASLHWWEHGARHPDASNTIVAQLNVHQIIKWHIFVADGLSSRRGSVAGPSGAIGAGNPVCRAVSMQTR